MLFIEDRFLVFFLVVFTIHWLLPTNASRKLFLFVAGCVFYAAWKLWFLPLMLFSMFVDLVAAQRIHVARSDAGRKGWLAFALICNLGLLGFFKYYNFFVDSVADFLRLVGMPAQDWTLSIVLPLGISFYTFETISYTIDVYRRRLEPVKNPVDYALFVTFFPHLIAGPIVRVAWFLPQLLEKRVFADVRVREAITLFLVGFIKKACISDNISPYSDLVFDDPSAYGSAGAWLGLALFSVQAYCDFSGYSDMALGLAKLLGYELPLNFDFPYFTRSVTRFWQHWHITLGRWFVDYVYVPLGGNRRGQLVTLRNVFLIMFLSGLWHGASWNFVIFGCIQGLAMVVERAGLHDWLERKPAIVGYVWVHFVWMLTLTLFRAPDIERAFACMRAMFLPVGMPEATAALDPKLWLVVLGFFVVHWAMWRKLVLPRLERVQDWAWALGLGAVVALVLPWIATDAAPVIYFQF